MHLREGNGGDAMEKKLKTNQLIQELRKAMEQFPDHRRGQNRRYEMADAGMGAFSVFFTQCASFLEHQRELNVLKGRSNVQSVFGTEKVPSDNQIRNLLDGVSPEALSEIWGRLLEEIDESGLMEPFYDSQKRVWVAIDGTEYFTSQQIHCEHCSHRERNNGKTEYFHSVLTPVIVSAEQKQVLALEPEFIRPQDGHDKQDCEIAAAKRWLTKHAGELRLHQAVILGDDLYSREPFCRSVLEQGLHFVLVCKPDSHATLYESVAFMENKHLLGTKTKRDWNGKYGEISQYQFVEQMPLTGEGNSLKVNWFQIVIRREDTGELIYKNAFVTDLELSQDNIEEMVQAGRSRWKVENENNNVLKNHGYHLEHNFGHGNQYLSSLLLSLNLLAFLFHTIADLSDQRYRAVREALVKRKTFFTHVEVLMSYQVFASWDDLLTFMFEGLELKKT